MQSELEIIDAFVDGERVDTTALKAALADAEGRDYLVDVWLLREAAHRDPAAAAVVGAPASIVRASWLPPRPWLLAAAFAGAVIGGYAIGYRTTDRVASPAVNAGSATVATTPVSGAFPVPPATRVIQLEFHPSPVASGGD